MENIFPAQGDGPVPPLSYKRDHPATIPHTFNRNSKTVQSTMDSLDRLSRSTWLPRDPQLSRKARRLRGTYATSDIVNHPELRLRVTRTPDQASKLATSLSANANIVTNDRNFFADGTRPGGLVSYQSVDSAKAPFARSTKSSGPRREPATTSTITPFYHAGQGLGPVNKLSLASRYGPTSVHGHSACQDLTLAYSPQLHDGIVVTDHPMTGTVQEWPSLGREFIRSKGSLAVDAAAAALGVCDIYEPPVNSDANIAPGDWPTDSQYTRGSAIVRQKHKQALNELSDAQFHDYGSATSSFVDVPNRNLTESGITVPRGIARSIERAGIRQTQVHEMALDKRRKQIKSHGRWLQGKNPSASKSASSVYTQYSEGGSMYDPRVISEGKLRQNKSKSKFNSRQASYGELASTFLELSGGPKNPYRNTMGKGEGGKNAESSIGSAGAFSVVLNKSSHKTKNRSELVHAVAKSVKSHRLASTSKIRILAEFGEIITTAPNNLPGHAAITELGKCLVDTASSNPNPTVISRNQFVMVVMGQLAHLDLQQAHQVYSCFDPNGREKMEFMEFLCCILAVHRPSMNALTSGHYIYARDYIKAIPIVVRGVEVFENGRGGITKHELRKILKSVCVSAEDRGVMDSQVDQIFKLLEVPFDKFTTPKILKVEEIIGRDGLLVRNSFVLDEYQRKLVKLQDEVQAVKDMMKENKIERKSG